MSPERLANIKRELIVIRQANAPGVSAGRYRDLMTELRQDATHEQQREVNALLARKPPPEQEETVRERLTRVAQGIAETPCRCAACQRWERVRERAWEYMLTHKITAACAVDQVLDLEREIEARQRWEASEA